ncbi:MAG: UDP-N-acetylmuramyl-tripeptide synthetase [Clostridiaceae bacterium]|mgnify:CR=1 FL=1|nr:UDP-N-acetylmuramyl-tripeptide synthetase [Clostridiaceae bacterium]
MKNTKNTNDLLNVLIAKQLLLDSNAANITIKKITFDSRQVEPGTLFFCKGANFKKQYLLDAQAKGAVAYISEVDYKIELPRIIVKDIRLAMSYLGKEFYNQPDRKLKLIGVTGSKGKSTTVSYVKAILDHWLAKQNKQPCGIISTIETFDGIINEESTITTPEALDLFNHLANAVQSDLEYMVLEVSSQALKYNRVTGIEFDIVSLLNLGRDHISPLEHPSYEDYVESKLRIFQMSDTAVFSKDMENINLVEQEIDKLGIHGISYSTQSDNCDYFADNIDFYSDSNHFTVNSTHYSLPGIGSYNIENALCAIALTEFFGIPKSESAAALKNIETLGRDNLYITYDKKIICHVSYAHTSLSFDKSFETIEQHFPDYQLIALFGASGSKGLNRIDDLPKSAAKHADFVYLIPDDPGFREHSEIADEMSKHLLEADCPYKIVEQREAGIREAFELAVKSNKKSLLFIAGKGSEHYQMIGNTPVPINSDVDVASKLVSDYNQKIKD